VSRVYKYDSEWRWRGMVTGWESVNGQALQYGPEVPRVAVRQPKYTRPRRQTTSPGGALRGSRECPPWRLPRVTIRRTVETVTRHRRKKSLQSVMPPCADAHAPRESETTRVWENIKRTEMQSEQLLPPREKATRRSARQWQARWRFSAYSSAVEGKESARCQARVTRRPAQRNVIRAAVNQSLKAT